MRTAILLCSLLLSEPLPLLPSVLPTVARARTTLLSTTHRGLGLGFVRPGCVCQSATTISAKLSIGKYPWLLSAVRYMYVYYSGGAEAATASTD